MTCLPDDETAGREWGRWTARLALRLTWIAVFSFALLLALRFGARTYPGRYFPDSPFLNSILNGNWLFTGFGYPIVLLGAAAAASRALLRDKRSPAAHILRVVQWVAIALAIVIVLYGVRWAIYTERLPWQPDGEGRYPPFASISR